MSKNNSIAIICDKNPCTSFGRLALNLENVLSELYSTNLLWLVTPKYFPEQKPPFGDQIDALNLELGWWTFRRPLRNWLSKNNPSEVLLLRPELGFLIPQVRQILPKTRISVMIHDMFAESLYPNSIKFKFINRFFISPTRTADNFIYNSNYTRSEAYRVMGLNPKGTIVGCPVDTDLFQTDCKKKAALKGEWGLNYFEGVCLNISLDEHRKNIPTFFELAKARPKVAFVRVGPFSPWMKRWIKEHGIENIFHYTGLPVEKLLELYHLADLFVYPSFLEGFGMPTLEALACGVPVVAAATSALKENLDGVAPLVHPPDKVEEYLNIIDKVLNGEDIVDWPAAQKLIQDNTIQNFGKKIRTAFGFSM